MPQSSPAPRCAPLAIASLLLLFAASALPLTAQGADRISTATDFHKEPGGTVLGRLADNAAVDFGPVQRGWRQVTISGWVPNTALRSDAREGLDVAVSLAGGVPLRTTPSSDAPSRGHAVAGALFDRAETRSGWTLVRRAVWVPAAAAATAAATPPPPPAPVPAAAPAEVPATQADSSLAALIGGSRFAAERGGVPIGQLEATRRVEVLDRRDGWTRLRLDVWVPDSAVTGSLPPGGVTGAEVRAEPERYVGRQVEWRLQVLAVREADELRPELPKGQPYVLARGPLPETGFVYLSVSSSQAATFRALDALTEVRVRATIRAGRSRFLPTPVLDFVQRLDD